MYILKGVYAYMLWAMRTMRVRLGLPKDSGWTLFGLSVPSFIEFSPRYISTYQFFKERTRKTSKRTCIQLSKIRKSAKRNVGHMFNKYFCCPFFSANEKIVNELQKPLQIVKYKIVSISGTDWQGVLYGSFCKVFFV